MPDAVRQLWELALPSIAERIERDNAGVAAARLGEVAHLQPATAAALEYAAAQLELDATVKRERSFRCDDWPSQSGVDIAVESRALDALVFCELKWGDGRSVLGECSWDLAKMALAIAVGACSRAMLLAAAPSKRWKQPNLEGAELFADGHHTLAHIRGPSYLDKYWAAYAREGGSQPNRLPTAFNTAVIGSAPIDLDDGRWGLRCVEVFPVGGLATVDALPST